MVLAAVPAELILTQTQLLAAIIFAILAHQSILTPIVIFQRPAVLFLGFVAAVVVEVIQELVPPPDKPRLLVIIP
jgi:hypothetical protein